MSTPVADRPCKPFPATFGYKFDRQSSSLVLTRSHPPDFFIICSVKNRNWDFEMQMVIVYKDGLPMRTLRADNENDQKLCKKFYDGLSLRFAEIREIDRMVADKLSTPLSYIGNQIVKLVATALPSWKQP